MTDTLPICPNCRRPMDRVDHHAIEHSILRDGVYRPVGIADGLEGEEFGLASEIDLRCGYCFTSIPQPARRFFYERWGELQEFQRKEKLS